MQDQRTVIPRPSPNKIAMFHNTNRNSLPFLRAAGIQQHSTEHKELKATVQALHRQYLHPFKHLEEQPPECIDQLIAKARTSLPWLDKYEDNWPARVYLKRYVDTKRPHLLCSRYTHDRRLRLQKSTTFRNCQHLAGNIEKRNDIRLAGSHHNSIMRSFLASLIPSLEHRLEAFFTLGIKDQETLGAFLSWPQVTQAQFLEEGHGVLQLTTLERKGLLVDCGLLAQWALKESAVKIPQSGIMLK